VARVIDVRERERRDIRNRALLEDDLAKKRLLFASRPYEAHVQFSNFCNMSCVMCWDGENPPLQRMAPELLSRVEQEVGPDLTVIIPHGASEPLVLTWEDTRRIAEQYSIDLGLTTNAQYLDEKKFHELEHIVESIVMSIDSHVPGVFERIRPRGKSEKVYENVALAGRMACEREIPCLLQVVFMTENAAMLPETVAFAAEMNIPMVNVLQLIDFNGRSGYSDPLLHFSAEYVQRIKQECIAVARDRKLCLRWFERETYDFSGSPMKLKPHRVANEDLDHWVKFAFPGYCKYAYSRIRVHADGEVAPCGWATEGDLTLGNVADQNLAEIWNGVNARDLRRAHLTADYPTLCKACRFTDPVPPQQDMPFLWTTEIAEHAAEAVLETIEPAHLARLDYPPTVRVHAPEAPVVNWALGISLGGGKRPGLDELHVVSVDVELSEDGIAEITVSERLWTALRTNMGYWWVVYAITMDGRVLRSSEVRCLIRNEPISRLAGSTLTYPDQDERPLADLGGAKAPGWESRDQVQQRPTVRKKPSGLWADPQPFRHKRRRKRPVEGARK
jgi:radical SAM protein with 4Fe4S-binding SPASM domain